MTDLEITRLCAEALSLPVATRESWERFHKSMHEVWIHKDTLRDGSLYQYDPLHDKAQAFALVEHFDLCVIRRGVMVRQKLGKEWSVGKYEPHLSPLTHRVESPDLSRAIVTCCARMQQARSETGG